MSNTSTELVQVTGEIVHRPTTFALTPAQANAWADQVRDMRRSVLHDGTDFMVIPGTNTPSLLKPGAEMLLLAAGLGFTMRQVPEATRFGEGVTYRCTIHRGHVDEVVGECEGYAGYDEDRFYTSSAVAEAKERANAKKYQRAANESKFIEYKAPWNSLLKMAQKRALVGATLNATASSGLFTQDLEDTAALPLWDAATTVGPSIETLDAAQTDTLKAWWRGQGLPQLSKLSMAQAAVVLLHIGAMAAVPPAPDPGDPFDPPPGGAAAPVPTPEAGHDETTADIETGEVRQPALASVDHPAGSGRTNTREYTEAQKLHIAAGPKGHKLAESDLRILIRNASGGRTDSANALTEREIRSVHDEMNAIAITPGRLDQIRAKVAEFEAGQVAS